MKVVHSEKEGSSQPWGCIRRVRRTVALRGGQRRDNIYNMPLFVVDIEAPVPAAPPFHPRILVKKKLTWGE